MNEKYKNASNEVIRQLLAECLESMENENDNREKDVHDIGCANCEAGVPIGHSLGCRIQQAISGML